MRVCVFTMFVFRFMGMGFSSMLVIFVAEKRCGRIDVGSSRVRYLRFRVGMRSRAVFVIFPLCVGMVLAAGRERKDT